MSSAAWSPSSWREKPIAQVSYEAHGFDLADT
jgi:hypothetical protein